MNDDIIIDQLFQILEELDARNRSNNCIDTELISYSWIELCEKGTELFKQLKE